MKTHPSRYIPALTNLIVFEHCARHLSFTRVGQKLGLSQGAISRQVIELEAYLGQPLFIRVQRNLILTPAGERYAELIRPHLSGLENATNDLRLEQARAGVLRVSASISLCNRWLVPRLPDLLRTYPELVINLSPEFSFGETQIDSTDILIVQAEKPPPASVHASLLLPMHCSAICAPQLLGWRTTLTADELLRLPLLHLIEAPRLWQDFLDNAGLSHMRAPVGVNNTSFILNIQFALAGLGVALLPEYLIEDELASGQLVRAFNHRYQTERAYYLTFSESRCHWPPAMQFCDWISGQARACRQRYEQ